MPAIIPIPAFTDNSIARATALHRSRDCGRLSASRLARSRCVGGAYHRRSVARRTADRVAPPVPHLHSRSPRCRSRARRRPAPTAASEPPGRPEPPPRLGWPPPFPLAVPRHAELEPLPAPAEDLWTRIRRGYAMPDIDDPLVAKWEQWYSSRPDYVARMVDRSRRYLYYIVVEVEQRGRCRWRSRCCRWSRAPSIRMRCRRAARPASGSSCRRPARTTGSSRTSGSTRGATSSPRPRAR